MEFVSTGEKKPLSVRYNTFPGWSSSLIQKSSVLGPTAKQRHWTTLPHRTSLNESHRPAHSSCAHQDLSTLPEKGLLKLRSGVWGPEFWEKTWPVNHRRRREANKLKETSSFYRRTFASDSEGWRLSKRLLAGENLQGPWAAGVDSKDRFHPAALLSRRYDKTDLDKAEREEWRIFTAESSRQPPSYPSPPAYVCPEEGRSESKKILSDQTGGQSDLNTQIEAQYSQHSTSQQMSPQTPDHRAAEDPITRRRSRGRETVFCLVSRIGDVSSSSDQQISLHVPLVNKGNVECESSRAELTDLLPCGEDHQNLLEMDKATLQLRKGTDSHTSPGLRSRPSHKDIASSPDENLLELECPPDQIEPQEKLNKELMEKFPWWKEPKSQDETEQSHEIQREKEELEKSCSPGEEHQQSLMLIHTSYVVVRVELLLLPEKEHVQYVHLPGPEEADVNCAPPSTTREEKAELRSKCPYSPVNEETTSSNSAMEASNEPEEHLDYEVENKERLEEIDLAILDEPETGFSLDVSEEEKTTESKNKAKEPSSNSLAEQRSPDTPKKLKTLSGEEDESGEQRECTAETSEHEAASPRRSLSEGSDEEVVPAPPDVLLCSSSSSSSAPPALTLWDAVNRIRRHTAPDSETEDESEGEESENKHTAATSRKNRRDQIIQ